MIMTETQIQEYKKTIENLLENLSVNYYKHDEFVIIINNINIIVVKLCQLFNIEESYIDITDITDPIYITYTIINSIFTNIYDTFIKKRSEINNFTRSCVCHSQIMFMKIKKYKELIVWNDYYDIAVRYALLDSIVARNNKYNASYNSSYMRQQSNFNIFNFKIKLLSIIEESKALELAHILLIHEINVFKEIHNMYTINNLDKILLE
jgi:hypothetical protein